MKLKQTFRIDLRQILSLSFVVILTMPTKLILAIPLEVKTKNGYVKVPGLCHKIRCDT